MRYQQLKYEQIIDADSYSFYDNENNEALTFEDVINLLNRQDAEIERVISEAVGYVYSFLCMQADIKKDIRTIPVPMLLEKTRKAVKE